MNRSTRAFPILLVLTAAVMVAASAGSLRAQSPTPDDPFRAVAFMIGQWHGTSEGQAGSGTVERTYDRILGERFVRVRNRSTYPPQEKNPKGEIHEDLGII